MYDFVVDNEAKHTHIVGGVFITWRQKDRDESQLGLYGKNAFFSEQTDDMFLVGDVNVSKYSNGSYLDVRRRRQMDTGKTENLSVRPLSNKSTSVTAQQQDRTANDGDVAHE